jgi:hypothetical protein
LREVLKRAVSRPVRCYHIIFFGEDEFTAGLHVSVLRNL